MYNTQFNLMSFGPWALSYKLPPSGSHDFSLAACRCRVNGFTKEFLFPICQFAEPNRFLLNESRDSFYSDFNSIDLPAKPQNHRNSFRFSVFAFAPKVVREIKIFNFKSVQFESAKLPFLELSVHGRCVAQQRRRYAWKFFERKWIYENKKKMERKKREWNLFDSNQPRRPTVCRTRERMLMILCWSNCIAMNQFKWPLRTGTILREWMTSGSRGDRHRENNKMNSNSTPMLCAAAAAVAEAVIRGRETNKWNSAARTEVELEFYSNEISLSVGRQDQNTANENKVPDRFECRWPKVLLLSHF